MHGDEQIGAEVALDLARRVCASYAARDGGAADALARSVRLVILPVADPWGYENDRRGNFRGTNINRNFDWAWDYAEASERGAAAGDSPEAAALALDARLERYSLAVALHSGDYRITLPWDYIPTSSSSPSSPAQNYSLGEFIDRYSPAYELFVARGAEYVGAVRASGGGPPGVFSMIEGCDWYAVCGSYADWLYMTLGCPCYTVELAAGKSWTTLQGATLGASVLQAHGAALVGLLSSAGMGARGRVATAGGTAVPAARVTATALPAAASRALPDPVPYSAFAVADDEGYFYLALPPGNWSLAATSGGASSAAARVAVGAEGYSASIELTID
jgi:hypothetical protein